MDLVQENNSGNILEDAYGEQLLSPEATDLSDDIRDPELLPRVGEQYQVEIPPLTADYDPLLFNYSSIDAKITCSFPPEVLVGLPISIMWINEEVKGFKNEPAIALDDAANVSACVMKPLIFSEVHDLKPKVEHVDIALDREINLRVSSNLASQPEIKIEMHQKERGMGYRLVPGCAIDSWSGTDEAAFLLGLYIFGKNLVQVQKFVGTKRMGEILSFYYGKFYRSDKYRRWSECRKIRSRKCIYGQRIFTGLRLQELLSRLLAHVAEECQNTLLEDSKSFGEGKMSLQEYVLTLRDKVGLNALVEAVGIGKGKQDLTGMAAEPLKPNQVVSGRPEIPIGKACSMLTPLEIINFLTGGYRLSKARSNDLFWEAVWPRLLARGWHSEEPNSYGCAAGSKHSLVFLIPGVKKFSRRKLVKGDHYFDSVSDVLTKVAADPGLLELEIGTNKGDSNKNENGWTDETKLDEQAFPDQQRHCYLKPRTPNRSMDGMKFTVVDTSLATGGTFKVRELRSLPVEMRKNPTLRSHSEDSDGGTSEEQTDESDSSDAMCSHRNEQNDVKPTKIDSDGNLTFDRNLHPIIGFGMTGAPAVNISDQKGNICNGTNPRKRIKAQLSQRLKPGNDICLGPVTKRRRRLTACNRAETTRSTVNGLVDPKLKQDQARCCGGNLPFVENISFQVDPSQEKKSSNNSSSKGSPVISGEGTLGSTCSGVEHPYEEPPRRRMIDLNLPISPEAETDEPFMTEEIERQPDPTDSTPGKRQPDQTSNLPGQRQPNQTSSLPWERQPDQTSSLPDERQLDQTRSLLDERQFDQNSSLQDDSSALKDSENMAASEQQPNGSARRHSTRNRPLTTKALEALAFGFLSTKQKRRFGESFPRENALPSRRARARARVTENLDGGIPDLQAEEQGNDLFNDNGDMCSELQL